MDDFIMSPTNVRLHSGCRIQELKVENRAQILQFFLGLSPEDRYSRFHYGANDYSIGKYVSQIDFDKYIVIGVFSGDELLGVAELYIEESSPSIFEQGEISIATIGAARGNGMSTVMLDCLKKKAVSLGLSRIHLAYLPGNIPMKRVAEKIGMFDCGTFDEAMAEAIL